MMDRALQLAAAGIACFPIIEGTKRPRLPGGFWNASTDPEQIREWWSTWPNDRIGVYPDRCSPRLLVVDMDIREGGDDGRDTLATLELEGVVPTTYEVGTPSGGRHLYLSLPDDAPPVQSSTRRLGPGLDVRSHGGYVLWYGEGPPNGKLAEAPAELIERCGQARERSPEADRFLVEPDLPANVERAQQFLRETEPAVSGAGGNNHTYATAEMVRDFGISASTCFDLMFGEWNQRCSPPWSDGELDQIILNAYRYAQQPAGVRSTVPPELLERGRSAAERQEGSRGPSLPFLTLDGLEGLPPPQPIVKGVLYEQTLGLMLGAWGQFKSFLALDLAAHIALGQPWAGRRVRKARDVLYVAAEGAGGISKRVAAWRKKHRLKPDRMRLLLVPPQFAEGGAAQLSEALREQTDYAPEVIIIDTLSSATAGLNENTSEDMGPVIEACRRIIREHRCTVILVHHLGKDRSKGARGWYGIEAAADTIMAVTRLEDDSLDVEFHVSKSKDGESSRIGFRGEVVELGRDEDGDPITSLAFAHDASVKAPATQTKEAKAVEMTRRIAAFHSVIGPEPIGIKPLAHAIAHEMLDEDASEGARALQEQRIYNWLRSVASGKTTAPEVLACHQGDGMWKRPS